MKAYVITVPIALDLANRCIVSARYSSVNVEIFEAIVPADNPSSLFAVNNLPIEKFDGEWSRIDNSLACFMSHFTLWKQCAEGDEIFLILEHDAVVRGTIPVDVDFKGCLSLGRPSYGKFIRPHIIGVQKLKSKQYFPGAHAYLLKPEAAKLLITQAKINACPTDVFLHNDNFDFLEEYYPWPVHVIDTYTTVQKEKGCLAKHSYRENPEAYQVI